MLNTWQNIVKNKMRMLGETQESLAEKLNVTQGSIAHWLSGRRKPDTDIISSIMKTLEINKIIINSDGSASENITPNEFNDDNFYIEVLDITSYSGKGYIDSDVMQVIKLVKYDLDQAKIIFKGINASDLKIINIASDSMQGTFDSGDAIYVDVSKKEFIGDGIYVFTFGQCLYVKRLQKIKNKLIVISDNKKYKEWGISEDEIDQLYIHGKVMLSQSMLLRKHG